MGNKNISTKSSSNCLHNENDDIIDGLENFGGGGGANDNGHSSSESVESIFFRSSRRRTSSLLILNDPTIAITRFENGRRRKRRRRDSTDKEIERIEEDMEEDEEEGEKVQSVNANDDFSSEITFQIDSKKFRMKNKFKRRVTILEAFEIISQDDDKVFIDSLCNHPFLPCAGKGDSDLCELGKVEIEEKEDLVPSCSTILLEGMKIKTFRKSLKVKTNINTFLKAKMLNYNYECKDCYYQDLCYFNHLFEVYRIRGNMHMKELTQFSENKEFWRKKENKKIWQNNFIRFDKSKCINCRQCIEVCSKLQGVNQNILKPNTDIEDYMEKMMFREGENPCISCGNCSFVCPTSALTEKFDYRKVKGKLNKKDEIRIAILDPNSTISFFEFLSTSLQESCPLIDREKYLIKLIKNLGFDYVFDASVGNDIHNIEDIKDLEKRIEKNGIFPMISSVCPSVVELIEKNYPHYMNNLSKLKPPIILLASLIRNYWIRDVKRIKKKVTLVSISNCMALKQHITRKDCRNDLDYSLTTRELFKLLEEKKKLKKFQTFKSVNFDSIFSQKEPSSRPSVTYSTAGGIMEATLKNLSTEGKRYFYSFEKNKEGVRGIKNIDANTVFETFELSDTKNKTTINLNYVIAHSCSNINSFLKNLAVDNDPMYFEFFSCYYGCSVGGGSPRIHNTKLTFLRREFLENFSKSARSDESSLNHSNLSRTFYDGDVFNNEFLRDYSNLIRTVFKHRKIEILSQPRGGEEVNEKEIEDVSKM